MNKPTEDSRVCIAREDLSRVETTDVGGCTDVQLAELLGAMTAATRGLLAYIDCHVDITPGR